MRKANRPWLICCLALAVTGGCAGSRSSRGGAADLARQEEQNRRLRTELSQKQAEAEQAWAAANRAEAQTQVAGAACSQLSAVRGGAGPRKGAPHGSVALNGKFTLRPRFGQPRTSGAVQVTPATCEVSR